MRPCTCASHSANAGLRRLNLSYNCLRCLPQALSSASQLTSLSISRNERFSLGPEDVEELLAPYLPALQTFDMVLSSCVPLSHSPDVSCRLLAAHHHCALLRRPAAGPHQGLPAEPDGPGAQAAAAGHSCRLRANTTAIGGALSPCSSHASGATLLPCRLPPPS